jgi:hypothetical protein
MGDAVTEDEFVGLVGERLLHVTLSENLSSISAHGLLRPTSLARMAGLDASALVLREDRMRLDIGKNVARLNNQMALRVGVKSAAAFLDGHSMESWSEQLDGRIFFWTERGGAAFAASHGEYATAHLQIDARLMFRKFAAHIDLAPINTGAARRKPARRGDWIYAPATGSAEDFRMNRLRRGLKTTPDTASEVLLRADIPAKTLAAIRVS